ncbi:hypothetical protein GPY51_21940 [Photorhabdus laumondii subsp. laumondii]|uniref:Uncharacterized protein n=1 Tax=Photorhabdus laumondii subsp. laumondii TaxID=141679 RepID=A0A6L9JPX6_PHOLM|nr:hypothetical protein [Photorhabdus laumondii]MCC8385312.1 hypothetical protein [Photorhabdus laumondii]MCC8414094.1 hypothetical protein [Photorhabdus laumondii]NDK96971.1 hypothetical protein [Photorhabdus laumondii subsp. laumondii]NDL23184.1 hypothetical protein [Photorhabdus laumondii subsp. laumondii]NDL32165.1 hypothetical protein [Photorhabdus laumondii subsp. laumondii]
MKLNAEVRGGNKLAQKLRQIHDRVTSKRRVLVGLPAGSGEQDGTPLVVIGAVNEFGATIQHPGGTSYGYKDEKSARDGKVRFLKNGQGLLQMGVTGPHTINIPERSFLRVPIRQNQDNIKKAFRLLTGQVARGDITAFQMLDQIGAKVAGYCKEAISAGIEPANAKSTVKAKGSSTPLIDDGILRAAITHVVED